MTRWLPIPIILGVALLACWVAQSPTYSPDPPSQTDRIFYRGWPRPFERSGGIAGVHDRSTAALAFNYTIFLAPALVLCGVWVMLVRRSKSS